MRVFLALFFTFFVVESALAQYPSPTYQNVNILGMLNVAGGGTLTGDVSAATSILTGPGSPVARTMAARGYDLNINVADYGALCNNVHDDTANINAALNAAHTVGTSNLTPAKIFFPAGNCIISNSLNMTGWNDTTSNGFAAELEGYGTIIVANQSTFVNGNAMIDALGSQFIKMRGISLYAGAAHSSGHEPSVGIQWGVYKNASACQGNHLDGPNVHGVFLIATIYVSGCEVESLENFLTQQLDASASTNLVLDGTAHWFGTTPAITSHFVTISITPDAYVTFSLNRIANGYITSGGGVTAVPIWISGAEGMTLDNVYANTNGANCVDLYTSAGGGNFVLSSMEFNIHCEGGMIANTFLLNGTIATPSVNGLRYSDPGNFSTTSVFALGGSATAGILQDLDLHIQNWKTGGSKVFDTPANWQASGNYYSTASGHWNAPSLFNGCLYEDLAQTCFGGAYTLSGAITAGNGRTYPITLSGSDTEAGLNTSGPFKASTGSGQNFEISGGAVYLEINSVIGAIMTTGGAHHLTFGGSASSPFVSTDAGDLSLSSFTGSVGIGGTGGTITLNPTALANCGFVTTTSGALGCGSGTVVTTTGTQTLTNKTLTAPTLTTPALGTPASGVMTNATGLPLITGVTGVLPIANGGTNASSASITAFNNITGYSAAGATGTTSGNLVFSISPALTGTATAANITTTGGVDVGSATVLTGGFAVGSTLSAFQANSIGMSYNGAMGSLIIEGANSSTYSSFVIQQAESNGGALNVLTIGTTHNVSTYGTMTVNTNTADGAFITGGASGAFYTSTAGSTTLQSASGSTIISDATVTLSAVAATNTVCTDGSQHLIACVGESPVLSGTTTSIGGGALLAGACTSGTVTVTGATTAMVANASPVTYPGDGFDWAAYVSAFNTVTVKVCGFVAGTPTASNYNVRVLQ